jgi:predicted ArsR family transcriptional regulator
MTDEKPQLYSVQQAADYLGLHPRTIQRHIYITRQLLPIRYGGGGQRMSIAFTREQLDTFQAEHLLQRPLHRTGQGRWQRELNQFNATLAQIDEDPEYLRLSVIQMLYTTTHTAQHIADIHEISRATVYNWHRLWLEGGIEKLLENVQ